MHLCRFGTLVASCLVLLAGCGGGSDLPAREEIALNASFDAAFDLVDMYGDPATDERFEGKPMLIYFGFTTCPEICPMALGKMTTVLDALGRDAENIAPIFITIDPERDTEARLRDHLAYDPRILGLTGEPDAIAAATKALHVYAAKVPLPESALGYTMDHTRLFYITDESGTPVIAIRDEADSDVIANAVRRQL